MATPLDAYGTIYFPLIMSTEDDRRRRSAATSLFTCCVLLGCVLGIILGIVGAASGGSDDDDDSGGPPTPAPAPTPFCCTQDPFAFPGSPWASASPTCCGDYDYNCDGSPDHLACCGDLDGLVAASCGLANHEPRVLYNRTADCRATPLPHAGQICGACTASPDQVTPGWLCTEPAFVKKRSLPECPTACSDDSPVVVHPHSPPSVGTCALYVDGCAGDHGGDSTTCCAVVSV